MKILCEMGISLEESDISDYAISVLDSGSGGKDLWRTEWLLARLWSSFLWRGCLGFGWRWGILNRLLVNGLHPLPYGVVNLISAEMGCADLVLLDVSEVPMLRAQQADELVRGHEAGQTVVLLLLEAAHELGQVLPDQLLLAVGELLREEGRRWL